MKSIFVFVALTLFTVTLLYAQDEGRIIKVDRLDKNMGVYFGLGPSFTLGKNVGDYSSGFNLEAGFLKRANRVLSWGGSASIIYFPYDPEVTGVNAAVLVDNSFNPYEGYYYEFVGGDVLLTSIAFTLKFNFVPVRDDSKVSLYGFAKPFITLATRTEITAYETYLYNYGDPNDSNDWIIGQESEYDSEDWDPFAFNSEFTGGIFIGPGIEFFPAKRLTFFLQASFGYTFPINFISLSSFEPFTSSIVEPWPTVKKGFPSVNVQLGISINF
jgi:hypothetical protein